MLRAVIDNDVLLFIKSLNLPYKGLTLSFDSDLDSSSVYFDLESSIKEYIDLKGFIEYFDCEIMFDSYTDSVFVKVNDIDDKEHRFDIFLTSTIENNPQFIDTWLLYLDSCSKINGYSKEFGALKESWIELELSQNSYLRLVDSITNSLLLQNFFKREFKFLPGILNGRLLKPKIRLYFPRMYKTNYYSDYIKVDYEVPNIPNLFLSFTLERLDQDYNVVSVVHNDAEFVSPFIHRGKLNSCKQIFDLLKEQKYHPTYFSTNYNRFNRIYFYTLQ